MSKNNPTISPWIEELNKERENIKLTSNLSTNVVIVGGGISGLTTAYFALRNTDKKVTLIEAGKIGHGATGRNAGQAVDYFEKPFSEMVDEYGLEMASEGQKAIHSAWDLLELIMKETEMEISFARFMGYAGCTYLEQLLEHFENKRLKAKGGVQIHKVRVAENFVDLDKIPAVYKDLYDVVPHSEVLKLLETENKEYIAVLQSYKGVINSALFVEKIFEYLLENYSDRFQLLELSPVSNIKLYEDRALLKVHERYVDCETVILCTNGFENLNIVNIAGKNIDKKFHDMVYSRVGYMTGYIEKKTKDPIAISYLPTKEEDAMGDVPYFYLTRRDHQNDKTGKSIVCIGGPEEVKTDNFFKYNPTAHYPVDAESGNLNFLKDDFKHTPDELDKFDYKWHGLMGYTESGIRCVGVEPMNNILMYNLGCNGVGILPSIYGAKKISDHLAGRKLAKTIFDPEVQRAVKNRS